MSTEDDLDRQLAEMKKNNICISCNGTGYYDSDGSPECGICDGTGKADNESKAE